MIVQVVFRLMFGMALTWTLARWSEITSGYFRIQMLITLGLSALAGIVCLSDQHLEVATLWSPAILMSLAAASAVTAYVNSILWMLERRRGGVYGLWVLLALTSLAVWGSSTASSGNDVYTQAQRQLSEYASGWMMGGMLSTMLLGHWYLTATGMKLSPFRRMNFWAGIAILVRSLLTAGGCLGLTFHALRSTDMVWLTLRWAGLIGPLILAILVMRILRYRNTQSATGVLYASTVLVFMGETAALLLARSQEFQYGL